MTNETESGKMFFENDDEFTDFAMGLYPVMKVSPQGTKYYDYEYNPEYTDALSKGTTFVILDSNSNVRKRGCVTRGISSLRVENVEGAWK